ncbi:DUF1631 family protein [Noviherbaspirillum sp. CPCC 100848]|uniref:DUF1631 family protein n=1 Tax=Noviherbaspirillum album TaxID=3080276 RepID=A0ABU6J6S1_9BURK|nr:DUF1631 family protein [Noviherbaspirillum sp. CPCC 100848]MEC4719333.1 DUF1631 family protein [Noviherbaspirillum sp. CPCC 100848]
MAETEYKRLILAAQSRAEDGFMALVQHALHGAERNIGERLLQSRAGTEQAALKAVLQFIRQDSSAFLRRIDGLYKAGLERAMQTMFIDLRPGLRNMAAAELSLIDDEVVNYQIEVGRLAQRMREATEESIGRLNVIIAQLHGQVEARERENPFRPYLLARALHDAVKTSAGDETRVRLLFEHLSDAMVENLPAFYASLRSVFETSGVHGKFIAQRSRHVPGQRYFGAPIADGRAAEELQNRLLPGLKNMFDSFAGSQAREFGHSIPVPGAAGNPNGEMQALPVQEFLRRMLSPARSFLAAGNDRAQVIATAAPALNPLLVQLDALQRQAASGKFPDGETAQGRSQLAVVRERLDLQKASVLERMIVDVLALLFEIMVEDPKIPPKVRQQIARLQIPVLKAAIIEPGLLHDEGHPARRLLNRIGSAATSAGSGDSIDSVGIDAQRLEAEVERLASRILNEFNSSTVVFEDSLAALERFLLEFVREDDRATAQAIEAVEAAERCSILLSNARNLLCEVLPPLNVDERVSDFILREWPHVLVRAARQDGEAGVAAGAADSLVQRHRGMLPELIWSIQDKQTPEDRSALMRMLPGLVKGLRQAFSLIQLPEDEGGEILDVLVELHTRNLRGTVAPRPARRTQPLPLDELRQRFARIAVSWEQASWTLPEPPRVSDAVIEEMLAERRIRMELRTERSAGGGKEDRDFLAQAYMVGTRVQFAGPGRDTAQLVWVSTHRSLYLFRQDGAQGALILYGFAALLEALRKETVLPVETAPAFERAVESLLFGAGRMTQASMQPLDHNAVHPVSQPFTSL